MSDTNADISAGERRRALFIDRDGTLIIDRDYIKDPAGVELLPGAAAALRRFIGAGFAPVVITNQSGIARGILTEADYDAVDARMDQLLAAEGVTLAGAYSCPHHPDFPYRGVARCDCRKPEPGLHIRAISELGLIPEQAVFIGDRWRDLEPSFRLGVGTAILVPGPRTPPDELERARQEAQVAADLSEAASLVLGGPAA